MEDVRFNVYELLMNDGPDGEIFNLVDKPFFKDNPNLFKISCEFYKPY